ncbi:UDP-glucose 4-epimerase GalE [Streptomyces alfalfae]|uniref:UDP-glucose 4-epimerase n=1 Tax=Streptomyces alfalfae TaxID=1642299 RepID=A0ABN4VH04_9ACTN|nr:UDP-glucose 4-epimerase GalE [Streptomyces alfalfae]AYA15541.1 UDP-glucose 4-epimerase GalE [Streptomyces fradiae]APY85197.1 UDP-glucose 4-epimerase GalE [Streptomyces alfalfae]QUI34998.1 UDP-glucose 4-epimerase GalE [Streptomyces alfalfae]RXX39017.1 UDP-glucose 4-epimerase GalE [Streptomyces alfalfae]RZM91354.1 UDP-glucose 4-epimerase GalE [Streptomyces alfalfae]
MTWLITGGAGYIGAHVARVMADAGEDVVVLDDVSSGVPGRLPADIPLIKGSSLDGGLLRRIFAEHGVTGVVHLAARKQVGESVEQPLRYYRENLGGLTTLLEAVAEAGVKRFVFSSSAAVYGNPPDGDLVGEDTPCAPVSPYGETKLAGEWLVRAAGRAHGIATVCLRYFNVAGAAAPELADTGVYNVVPMVFDRLTRDEAPRIFGDTHPTPDGTCVRDYIHVSDLADAHLAAARRLARGAEGDLTVNIGRGEGVSVRELIDLIGEVTGDDRPALVEPARAGDAPRAVADARLAARELDWRAGRSVREMVESAWAGWCLHHPEARRDRSGAWGG